MRRLHVAALVALTAVGVLGSAGTAGAAPEEPLQWQGAFNTAPIGGLGQVRDVDFNPVTGNILVLENDRLDQFNASGEPVDFPATGTPTLSVPGGERIFIEKASGPTQGYTYVPKFGAGEETALWIFSPTGELLVPSPPRLIYYLEPFTFGQPAVGAAVGADGKVWSFYVNANSGGEVRAGEMTPLGESTQTPFSLGGAVTYPSNGSAGAWPTISDDLGNFYLPGDEVFLKYKYDPSNGFTLLGDSGLPRFGRTLDQLEVDPTTHDLYGRNRSELVGVPYSQPLVASKPFIALKGISSDPAGFAIDASGDFYVGEGNRVSRFHREPAKAPFGLSPLQASGIRSSRVVLSGELSTGGAATSYRFEYGTDTSYGETTQPLQTPRSLFGSNVSGAIDGLRPNTTYHVRMVATNPAGTSYGPDRTFRTYGISQGGADDSCPNALARKQTVAQRLPDCRAYELVSASDTGGYDVESYLAPGQTPFPGFPLASDKVLYSTHSGAIPGPWNATNKGPDPYVATRSDNGWITNYKGLPSDINPAAGTFSSVLGEADSGLSTLAFAGANLCSPCFTSGLETGVPLRLPSGQLVQGMAGSLGSSVDPSAKPEGRVAKYFSEDGRHLVFASKYAFEPGAHIGGDLTVYDRNLATSTTQIASTDQNGAVLAGTVSELDVSANGSRIVTATKTGEDAQGNELTHPYMHIGSSPNSVDLAPGATAGVLFAGMTSDGSKVFFTTADKLSGDDTDAGADLYEAAVDGSGNLDLNVITAPDSNACSPVANSNGAHWNTGSTTADCSAVAISGGGGVASASGAVYFLSPEQLDGTKGTLNQPNLYLAQLGNLPTFVATLEPDNPLVLDSVKANTARRTGDFQVTPGGGYAVFTSALELTGIHTFGFLQIFRYSGNGGSLVCSSCDLTGSDEVSLAGNAELAPNGLSLLADGRLFFTTSYPMLLNDANGKKDVYEWSDGSPQLISAGTGPFDSALLSASADGTDAFFFTRDALAREEDRNGALMRIYDAREGGGFFKLPAAVPCQASDECHGPGSPPPGPADIKSSGKTTAGNVLVCSKKRVKKRGACVKKKTHAKKKHKKRKGAAKKRAAGSNGKRGGRNA